jgi:hypothetical protein
LELLRDGELKDVLANAQQLFDRGDYLQTLIECRKVIYLAFETWYTIDKFRDPSKAGGGLGALAKAPYYCRNVEWIRQNVKDPFGYIVLDHDALDKELLTEGIEPTSFWNIWRGTPQVFRYEGTTQWLVKRELDKEESGATEEHAAYILEQTIDIALRHEEHWRRIRSLGRGKFVVRLKRDGVNIYSKADRSSAISAVTENGLREIGVTESTLGLEDEGPYWKVVHVDRDRSDKWYWGYLHNDDIDWSTNPSDS